MPKISGLIFSADPIKETLAAAKHLLEFTDEVVIIYSKSYKDYKNFTAKNKDKRIRVFYALKFGYPEPFREYGIKLCKYKNITMLDVDERLSDTKRAKELIDSGKSEVYVLYRKEAFGKDGTDSYTKQYRLFTKDSIEWRGYLHETPRVTGRESTVPRGKLHIIHGEGNKGRWHYYELDKAFPVDRPIKRAVRESYVAYSTDSIPIFSIPFLTMQKYGEYKRAYNALPDKNKEIIKDLRRLGIIRYLSLDNPRNLQAIIREHKGKEQGIKLLIGLIYKRYEKQN